MLQDELDVLKDVSSRLMDNNIPFMLTGSMAMSYYAIPRMTRDIDIVIEIVKNNVKKIIQLFQGDYYISSEAVEEAVTLKSTFNIIHNESVIKVDFIVRKDSDYRQEEFKRKKEITINDFNTYIVSKEDLIISKILWAKETASDYQVKDIKNLMESEFDVTYVKVWVEKLKIDEFFNELYDG